MNHSELADLFADTARRKAAGQYNASRAVRAALQGDWDAAKIPARSAAVASEIWERLPEDCRTFPHILEAYDIGMEAVSRAVSASSHAARALWQADKGLWDEAQRLARRAASYHYVWGTFCDAVASMAGAAEHEAAEID